LRFKNKKPTPETSCVSNISQAVCNNYHNIDRRYNEPIIHTNL